MSKEKITIGEIVQRVLDVSPTSVNDVGALLANVYILQLGGADKAKEMTALELLTHIANSRLSNMSVLANPKSVIRAWQEIKKFYNLGELDEQE